MAITKVTRTLLSTGIVDNSNATAITIDSSENVGIGTASPAKKLEVAVTGSNQASTVRIQGTDGNGNGHPLDLKMDGATDAFSVLIGQGGGATPNTVLFSGNRNGNVGIGTSSPTSYYSGADNLVVHQSSGEAGITIATANNTTGAIYFADGTSGSEAYQGGIAYSHGAEILNLVSGGSNKMTIDSSGNVGIGTSSPTAKMQINDASSSKVRFLDTTDFFYTDYGRDGIDAYTNTNGAAPIFFKTGGSERMRLDTSGNLLVGTTGGSFGAKITAESTTSYTFESRRTGTGNEGHIAFRNANGAVGTIFTNGSTTAYNTSSDYRLKENVDYDFNALDRVAQLKPARFNFIVDGDDTTVDGFLAHEVQDIIPEAVTGEKDAVKEEEYEVTPAVLDDDGNVISEAEMGTREVPDYQGIDQSKLVPLLTKAIQEQQTIIDDLKTRIETLENA